MLTNKDKQISELLKLIKDLKLITAGDPSGDDHKMFSDRLKVLEYQNVLIARLMRLIRESLEDL